jgi:fructose 1,6-bisphosphate aldolase/phosphatase
MTKELTLSVIKADVGGYVGHSHMHPDLLDEARERSSTAKLRGPIIDFQVTSCGDDIGLIMTHDRRKGG